MNSALFHICSITYITAELHAGMLRSWYCEYWYKLYMLSCKTSSLYLLQRNIIRQFVSDHLKGEEVLPFSSSMLEDQLAFLCLPGAYWIIVFCCGSVSTADPPPPKKSIILVSSLISIRSSYLFVLPFLLAFTTGDSENHLSVRNIVSETNSNFIIMFAFSRQMCSPHEGVFLFLLPDSLCSSCQWTFLYENFVFIISL